MKKLLAALVCFALCLVMLSGCSINVDDDDINFGINGISTYNYDDASEYTASSDFSVDASEKNINEIDIDWVTGDVTVKVTDNDKIHVSETGAEDEDDIMRYRVSAGTLDIKWRARGKYDSDLKKSVVLEIPEALADAFDFDAELVSADIEIDGLKCKELSAEAVSGDIKISDCTARELSVGTVSGNCNVSGCTADEFSADSTSGEIDAEGTFADIGIETVSGGAKVRYTGTLDEMEISSVSGDLELVGDAKPSKISIGTVSGGITCYGERKVKDDFSETNENGSGRVEIETVSGDIDFDISQ